MRKKNPNGKFYLTKNKCKSMHLAKYFRNFKISWDQRIKSFNIYKKRRVEIQMYQNQPNSQKRTSQKTK